MDKRQEVAADIGYGYTKGMTPGKPPFICPSLVVPARDIRYESDLAASNGITVTVGQDQFFVGDKAELQGRGGAQTLSNARTGSVEQMALLYAALSDLVKVETTHVTLVTGLPVADYSPSNKKLLTRALKGDHVVERVGRQPRAFQIDRVAVVPQAVGCLYGLVLDKAGQVTQHADLQAGRVGVIDVGQFTTNFVTLDMLRYVDILSTSREVGVSRMLSDLQRDLRDEFDLSLDKLSLVDRAVREGSVVVRGQRVSITEQAGVHIAQLGDTVIAQAASLWGKGVDLTAVVLTGGGAYLLADRVQSVYSHTRVTDDAQFGNVVGYLRLALREKRG